jgi:para-aminobenzoate synthetase/4-amino-4-deoxychorismate lyase
MPHSNHAISREKDAQAEWMRRLSTPGTILIASEGNSRIPRWRCYHDPEAILAAHSLDEVRPTLREVDRQIELGRHVCGQIAYEAAPGIDAALKTHEKVGNLPLVWFGVYQRPVFLETLPELPGIDYFVGNWRASLSSEDFQSDFQKIRRWLHRGESYQVNHTLRFRAPFAGNAYALFLAIFRRQPTLYSAFLNLGEYQVASVSPELFFQSHDGEVTCRPMKGTRACETTWGNASRELDAELRLSEKDRAENVMIVDMIRNDLGRIAEAGSVRCDELFAIEHHPTVVQMTSTLRCRSDASFSECLGVLFPCSSVTGAPKVRTMEIIEQLEPSPRGVYTGAIGMANREEGIRMSVAIRTACVDRQNRQVEYGSGAGIVWDSEADREYEEIGTKARIVTESTTSFQLLETMRYGNARYFLLQEHLGRLETSARYFGFSCSREKILRDLLHFAETLPAGRHRVRLLLHRSGKLHLTSRRLETPHRRNRWEVRLAPWPVDRDNPFLRHKTTRRELYQNLQQSVSPCDEVLLHNQDGELTEGCISNLVLRLEGRLVTPTRESGLLDGTLRRALLDRGRIVEQVLRREDLESADAFWMINSVRGFQPARLI